MKCRFEYEFVKIGSHMFKLAKVPTEKKSLGFPSDSLSRFDQIVRLFLFCFEFLMVVQLSPDLSL